MPGFISQTYATLLLEHYQKLGRSAKVLRLPAPLPERLPLARWLAALTLAAQDLRDPLLGLSIGRLIEPRHFGVVGYVTQQCPTLLDAARQIQRFLPLISDASPLQHRIVGRKLVFVWPDAERHYDRLMEQVAVGVSLHYLQKIAVRAVSPAFVHLVQDAGRHEKRFRQALGCPVRFGCAQTEVGYSLKAMATAVSQPDAVLLTVLQKHAEQLLNARVRRDAFLDTLQGALSTLIAEQSPTLAATAEQLGISVRTLQRRLQERGLHFQQILDETRVMLARDHLRNRALRITDVAMLLGYSEQSAFDRAFRRCTGQTPKAFRRAG